MADSLQEYKVFIDGLVKLRGSVLARRFREGVWHCEQPPDQVKYNELLATLSQQQRDLIADILDNERSGSIHDVLVFITDRKYRVFKDETMLAVEPFGMESFFDYVARSMGDSWPDEA